MVHPRVSQQSAQQVLMVTPPGTFLWRTCMHMVSILKPSPAQLPHQFTRCQLHVTPARGGVRLWPCYQLMLPQPMVPLRVSLQSAPRDPMAVPPGAFHWRTCMHMVSLPKPSPALLPDQFTHCQLHPVSARRGARLQPYRRLMVSRPMVPLRVSLRSAPRDPMAALLGIFHWRACPRRSSQAQLTHPHRRRQLRLQRDRRVVPSALKADHRLVAPRSPVLQTPHPL